jgi:hypothetical protein
MTSLSEPASKPKSDQKFEYTRGYMMLEPAHEQRSRLNDIQGTLALVQFLSIKDQAAFNRYRSACQYAVGEVGGQRTHDVGIDQYLARGEMHFQAITVDQFPSSEAAQKNL